MAILLYLCEADRKRLGAPEHLVFDQNQLMMSEAVVLDTEFGWDVEEFLAALGTKPVLDAEGNAVPGRIRVDFRAWAVAIWIALKRSGVDIPFSAVDYDTTKFRIATQPVAEVPAPDPKDPSTRGKPKGAGKQQPVTS